MAKKRTAFAESTRAVTIRPLGTERTFIRDDGRTARCRGRVAGDPYRLVRRVTGHRLRSAGAPASSAGRSLVVNRRLTDGWRVRAGARRESATDRAAAEPVGRRVSRARVYDRVGGYVPRGQGPYPPPSSRGRRSRRCRKGSSDASSGTPKRGQTWCLSLPPVRVEGSTWGMCASVRLPASVLGRLRHTDSKG